MAKQEPVDAITLLKADHRKVEDLFEQFDSARRSDRKASLVAEIVTELKIHTEIEETIFYPGLRGKIDGATLDEGYVEHDGAKMLINDLAQADPKEDFYDAKVKVLAEEIKHHVAEEERWITGMFAQAKRSDADLDALGAKMAAAKEKLLKQAKGKGLPVAKPRAVKLVKA